MSHWQNYPAQWNTVGPPLRTSPEVVSLMQDLTGHPLGRVLLLGVTPELADAFPRVLGVDKSPDMVRRVWPGDTAEKKAVVGDWLEIGEPSQSFAAVVGDGSLNNVAWPDEVSLLMRQALRLLRPGARFACRLFERPPDPLSWDDLAAAGTRPATVNFHAFKWQLAMRIAEDHGATLPVTAILHHFDRLFPDRDALSERTGWPRRAIDTIGVYRGSPLVYCFPNRAEFLSCIPPDAKDISFTACGTYDLAECCPVLSFASSR
ncbi:class I SAM-dependent methyltransferase [Aestuariivirga sp.]|uniref:class I SAM-dependent methyltransferase n=1 Tax=Aestuariivirga sp. TaxID=2650926 RepID=UPI0039E35B4D